MSTYKKILIVAGILIATVLYVNGALSHAREVNFDRHRMDQSAYMAYAKSLADSGYTFVGGRNRMPIYPLLQSFFVYRSGMSDEDFFELGKRFNIGLSVILLLALIPIFTRHLPWHPTLNLMLIVAFTLYLFKAAYFQTEVLFFFANICSFLLLNQMLHRPTWKRGIVTGIVLGLAHLTKGSVLGGPIIYVCVAVAQEIIRKFTSLKADAKRAQPEDEAGMTADEHGSDKAEIRPSPGQPAAPLPLRLISIACVVVFFLLTVSPYITTSKRVFGHYFYNVNTTFYIWYDSWEEAKQGTRAYGDRVGWPDMPPEEIPTLQKYLREHTLQQIVEREFNGLQVVWDEAVHSYGYFKYFALYTLFTLLVLALNWPHTTELFKRYTALWVFNLLYFSAYLLLYAWYVPIAYGNRLTLGQFIPLMFALSFVIYRLIPDLPAFTLKGKRFSLAQLFSLLITLILSVDLYSILTYRILTLYGGE